MSIKAGDVVFVPDFSHPNLWHARTVAGVQPDGRTVFVWVPNPRPHGPREYRKLYYRSELLDVNMNRFPPPAPARPSFVSRVVARLWRK